MIEFNDSITLYHADIAHECSMFLKELDTLILAEEYVHLRDTGEELIAEAFNPLNIFKHFIKFIQGVIDRLKKLLRKFTSKLFSKRDDKIIDKCKELADKNAKVKFEAANPSLFTNIEKKFNTIEDLYNRVAIEADHIIDDVKQITSSRKDMVANYRLKKKYEDNTKQLDFIEEIQKVTNESDKFFKHDTYTYSAVQLQKALESAIKAEDQISNLHEACIKTLEDDKKAVQDIANHYKGGGTEPQMLSKIMSKLTTMVTACNTLLSAANAIYAQTCYAVASMVRTA